MLYKELFRPIKIGSVEIKNRIGMAPLQVIGLVNPGDDCYSPRVIDYYVERAKGGTGLIITGATEIENDIEKSVPGIYPSISTNPLRFIGSAGELTERVHAYGCKIFIQLTLGLGRSAPPEWVIGQPVAPSPIQNHWNPSLICRELSTKEVETLVRKAGEAAEVAAEAGFDGVEIHAAHEGYLLDQFMIARFNKRTDKYGGDLQGRLTFPIEIVQEIKKRVGKSFPVQIRYAVKSFIKDWNQGALPGEEFEEKGRDLAEGLEIAKILEQAGYDAFNADASSVEGYYWAHPPSYQEHGCYLDLVKELKRVVNVPVLVAGRMDLPEVAHKAIIEQKADMILLGRGLLADSDWPEKVREGSVQHIRPCLGCHDGCLTRTAILRPLSCAVNPACGREKEYGINRAGVVKKVMVVGGGIAGMEAARVAALRGHQVLLFEKTNELGGHVREASVPDFKRDGYRLLDWYENELQKLNVTVNFLRQVSLEQVVEEKPDVVIVATGSRYSIPAVPGIHKKNVATATDFLLGKKSYGDSVIVIGGGLVGCEVALWLRKKGKKVTIIERQPNILSEGSPLSHAKKTMIIDLLNFHKVNVVTDAILSEIKDDGVEIRNSGRQMKHLIFGDTICIATGLESEQELFKQIKQVIPNTYLIGDARRVQNIMSAIWDGYEVARNI